MDRIRETRSEEKLRPFFARSLTEGQLVRGSTFPHMGSALVLPKQGLVVAPSAHFGLRTFDIKSGRRVWSLEILGGVEGSPVSVGDAIYFGANDGKFYKVQIRDGKVLWELDTQSDIVSRATVSSGKVFVQTSSQSVFAIDAKSGQRLWTYSRRVPQEFSIRGNSTPLVVDGVVYAGFSDGFFVAVSVSDGSLRWEVKLNRNKRFRDVDSGTVKIGPDLLVTSFDDATYRLRASDGTVIWRSPVGSVGRPLALKDQIVVSGTSGHLVSINPETGKELWRMDQRGVSRDPILVGSGFIFTTESAGGVLVVDPKTGGRLKSFQTGRGVLSGAAYDESKQILYAVSNQGVIYGFQSL